MTIPELRPADREGRLLCGWKAAGLFSPECGEPAVWHVAWSLTAPALSSLMCHEHLDDILESGHSFVDCHFARQACDMPGTGWSLDWERPGCVVVTTEDVER